MYPYPEVPLATKQTGKKAASNASKRARAEGQEEGEEALTPSRVTLLQRHPLPALASQPRLTGREEEWYKSPVNRVPRQR